MGNLSIVLNEKINLKIIKDNPDYLLRYEKNYFVSKIGKDLFDIYKLIYFDKQMKLTDQNILLFGNTYNNEINEKIIEAINDCHYDLNNFDEYYIKLKHSFIQDNFNNHIVNDLMIQSQTKENLDIDKLNNIIKELQNNVAILSGTSKLFKTPEQMLNCYEEELRQILDGKVYSIGCSHLDKKMILGARPKLITTIFADTGLGKSSFSSYLDNKRLNKNIPSLTIQLENDNFLETERKLSMRWQKNIRNYYNIEEEQLQEDLFRMINREKEIMKRSENYLFVEEAGISISDVEYLIIEAKKTLKVNYLVCTIDLVGMLTDFGTEAFQIEKSMNRLHEIARRQNIHFILITQANRDVSKQKIKTIDDLEKLKPSLGHIKNSGAFAERSRVILGLFRKKHYMAQYFPEDPRLELEEDIVDVFLLKQNAGPISLLKYLFFPEITYFVPLIKEKEFINE